MVNDEGVISKERAVELVESLLAAERLTWAGPVRELAVYSVEEHAVGWLVFWNSAEYARTRGLRDNLVGNGPYLTGTTGASTTSPPPRGWPRTGRSSTSGRSRASGRLTRWPRLSARS